MNKAAAPSLLINELAIDFAEYPAGNSPEQLMQWQPNGLAGRETISTFQCRATTRKCGRQGNGSAWPVTCLADLSQGMMLTWNAVVKSCTFGPA